MILKKAVNILSERFSLEEVNIIEPSNVVFSGSISEWAKVDTETIPNKSEIENCEVCDCLMYGKKKVFLFIAPIGVYYPSNDDFEPITNFFKD